MEVEDTARRPIALPAIFSGVSSRKDRSYKLTFDTRELGGDDAALLLGLHQTEGHLLFSPTDTLTVADIPKEDASSGITSKTPSQRLRAVLFVYWKQLGSQGDFEAFYRSKLENIIDQYKERLGN